MKMDKTRILPGELLVNKGALKATCSLPEVGLKDIVPNGSWLEQKQIQAALEARKQLIELERIEKSGVLSLAEWSEELMLAEVTKMVGGHWQYLGHNIGKQLYLNPEEALFLMEVNCLVLKYNEVKVSLQQAYALLLRSKITLMHYKVYASLSRLGYRVFRHQRQSETDLTDSEKKKMFSSHSKHTVSMKTAAGDNINGNLLPVAVKDKANDKNVNSKIANYVEQDKSATKVVETKSGIECLKDSINTDHALEPNQKSFRTSKKAEMKQNKFKNSKYIQHKINKLKRRKFKISKCDVLQNCFGNFPEFNNNPVVYIQAPPIRFVPANVCFKNSSYCLNIGKLRTKSTDSEEMPSTSTSSNHSLHTIYQSNLNHVRQQSPHNYRCSNWSNFSSFNVRISSQANHFRSYNFWRPQFNFNYFHLNMTFQRPFLYPQFAPRVFLQPFSPPLMASNFNESESANSSADRKKRTRDTSKKEHYDSIQKLAGAIKRTILESDNLSDQNVSKLNHLIQTYNKKYKARIRLSDDFTVLSDENIIDSIEVDDDEEQTVKKAKKNDTTESFDDKLQRIKQLANRLKTLEIKNEITSRHRRVFSNLIKKFNTSYNVDYYVNVNYDVIDRNDLTAHSSSDTEKRSETTSTRKKRKKLKNPFFILKQLSDKQKEEESRASVPLNVEVPFNYSKITINTFKDNWLPDESDFGRAEIISKDIANDIIDVRREEFLFDFIKIQPDKFKNWVEVKVSFFQCLQKTCELFHYNATQTNSGLQSLVKLEEFTDATSLLEKLRIIKNNKETNNHTELSIDFDVYNRNVQNFKKSNRPLPHFRVICLKESSTMPTGADVTSLHSKYNDNVAIVFAVVGTDSISYVQVDPTDLPVVPSNNRTMFYAVVLLLFYPGNVILVTR